MKVSLTFELDDRERQALARQVGKATYSRAEVRHWAERTLRATLDVIAAEYGREEGPAVELLPPELEREVGK